MTLETPKLISDELLDEEERLELIETSRPNQTPSLVQYSRNRKMNLDKRRSFNYRWRVDSSVSRKCRQIAADLYGLPIDHAEPIDVVRYERGGFFGDHHDGQHRIATLCISLNDDFTGGDLVFPKYKLGATFRPRAGSGVLWPNDTLETIHRCEPVTDGEKWIAVVWIRSSVAFWR